MFIRKSKHDAIVAKADALIDATAAHVADEEFRAVASLPLKVALAVKRLGEARNNAFRHRQRVLTLEAKLEETKVDAAELAHWRQYGQLRCPKTGRLIPKREAAERKGEGN